MDPEPATLYRDPNELRVWALVRSNSNLVRGVHTLVWDSQGYPFALLPRPGLTCADSVLEDQVLCVFNGYSLFRR
jgi:hypothetical protein